MWGYFSEWKNFVCSKKNYRKKGKNVIADILDALLNNLNMSKNVKRQELYDLNVLQVIKLYPLWLRLNFPHYFPVLNAERCFNRDDVYPSYFVILKFKSICYPQASAILITERQFRITLQSLLNHITRQLLCSLHNVETKNN